MSYIFTHISDFDFNIRQGIFNVSKRKVVISRLCIVSGGVGFQIFVLAAPVVEEVEL
jgi:hypothetical protein